jgi:hypothetical protein
MNEIIELCDELECDFTYSHFQHLWWSSKPLKHEWRIMCADMAESNTGLCESYADCLQRCEEWLLQVKAGRQA